MHAGVPCPLFSPPPPPPPDHLSLPSLPSAFALQPEVPQRACVATQHHTRMLAATAAHGLAALDLLFWQMDGAATREVLSAHGLRATASLGLPPGSDVNSEDPESVERGRALLMQVRRTGVWSSAGGSGKVREGVGRCGKVWAATSTTRAVSGWAAGLCCACNMQVCCAGVGLVWEGVGRGQPANQPTNQATSQPTDTAQTHRRASPHCLLALPAAGSVRV
eukprot:358695-Chlamydomonas_euryale.AAC.2